MTAFPGSIYSPRERANWPKVEYNPLAKTRWYKEDADMIENEIIEVEKKVGLGASLPEDGKVLVGKPEGASAWEDPPSPPGALPPGVIFPYGGETAPSGFLLCNGTSHLVADYPDLFAVLEYQYGGSGANFNLPNLEAKFPKCISFGDPGGRGIIGGSEFHAHGIGSTAEFKTSPADIGTQASGGSINTLTRKEHTHSIFGDTDPADTNPPYILLNYIIKT